MVLGGFRSFHVLVTTDVNYLKYLMRRIRRLDIEETLTEYEVKRDLTILLDFYARKRQGLDFTCCSHNVRRVAGYLTRLMDMVRDNIDIVSMITSEFEQGNKKCVS